MLNNVNYDIDITKEPPADDTARQYYFIEKAKAYVQRESEELGRPLTFCVTTFGCQMNARDSEKLCGILEKIGYVEAAEDEADFIIFNTCTVRENANMRVYGRLGQLKPRKKKNPHMMIGLCGCMMQEPEVVEKLKTSYRYVDIIFGTHNIFKFAELIVTRFESQRMVIDIWKDTDKIVENLPNDRKFSFKSGVISCLDVITSAVTVSYHMYVEEKEAVILRRSYPKSASLLQMVLLRLCCSAKMSILMVRIWNIRLHLPSFLKELNRSKDWNAFAL